MAQRRMFSLKVVDTDMFLDMSPSAQNLYFHLGMRADDDGFVSSPKKIMVMVNAAENDYQILVAKGFIIPMSTNGVCVVTHWKTNNLIKSDRYTETEYKDEKERLIVVEGKYTYEHLLTERQKKNLSIEPFSSNGSESGTQMEPQVRLGKVSLVPNAFQENLKSEKKKVETARPQTFEEFMEEKGYVFGELKDNDGGIIDMWLNGNRGVSAGLLKSLQADHKRLYPELYVGKTAPPLKESVIDEIVVIWNSYHTLPANLGAFNNKTAKTLLPKVDHQSFDLKREIKKKLKFYPHVSDWERAIKAYASEILNRDPSQSYALHRLSLYEFVLQKNGLIKFFNK